MSQMILQLPSTVCSSSRLAEALEAALVEFVDIVAQGLECGVRCPADLFQWEKQTQAEVAKRCVDRITGTVIKDALEDPSVEVRAQALLSQRPHHRLQKSRQRVTVDLLGGSTVDVVTPYFLDRSPRKGRKPRPGQRGRSGHGIFPLLAALGIHERFTPAYGAEIARMVVLGSMDQARAELARRGVKRDKKAIRRVVHLEGRRALAHRKWRTEALESPPGDSPLAGKTVGIFLDGGRLRVRLKKRGRKRKNGGKSFQADWREPRVLVVLELGERGRKARNGFVRYDATLANADETFVLLEATLKALGADQAALWVVGGDGAQWIWRRVPGLVSGVGFDPERVTELVDFRHAVGYLWEYVGHRSSLSDSDRKRWVRTQQRRLKGGKVEQVIAEMRNHCYGRNAKKLKRLANRFAANVERMQYANLRDQGLPCGTGAVESAVRRIVNLRLKGNSIFWEPANAEGLLHLRALCLSGCWEEAMTRTFEPEPFWRRHPARDAGQRAA